MNNDNIKMVQDSWEKVALIASDAAMLFYNNLFALDPNLKALFKGDMVQQGAKLTQMIGVAVSKLDDLESIALDVQQLGHRHATYGVQDIHYDTVGVALIQTLEQGLGEAFTDDVRAAWVETYQLLSSVMKPAANSMVTESGGQ